MTLSGSPLLHEVGKRIIARYLESQGATGVEVAPPMRTDGTGVDIRFSNGVDRVTAKVKVDCYCGTDQAKIANRDFLFYRADTASYGLEEMADTTTRASGWVHSSMADRLYYYRLAIARPEAEVRALLESPDGVFFTELGVERDDLRIMPMAAMRAWFETSNDLYPPRPVMTAGYSAWYRIVPMTELEAAVPGVRVVGTIYPRLGVR